MRVLFIFLTLFYGIILTSIPTSASNKIPVSETEIPWIQTLAKWKEGLQSLHTAARSPNPGEAPLESDGVFNPFRLLYLDALDMSPLSGRRGYGEWQDFGIGQARLISAYSGTRNNDLVFLNVQINLKESAWLKNPILTDTTLGIKSLKIPMPGVYRIAPRQSKLKYRQDIFLPLIYRLENPKTPTDFKVRVVFDVCEKDTCLSKQIDLNLTLTSGDRYATSLNAKMIQELQQTPQPLKADNITAVLNAENKIQIRFSNLQNMVVFYVYPADTDWEFDYVEIDSTSADEVFVTVTLPKDKTDIKTLPLIFETSKGFFETVVSPVNGLMELPEQPIDILDIISVLSGLILFSPFYAFLFMQTPKTKKQKRLIVQRIFTCAVVNMVLFLVVFYAWGVFPDDFMASNIDLKFWMGWGMCVVLLIYLSKSLWMATTLFWLIPKGFMNGLIVQYPIALCVVSVLSLLLFLIPMNFPDRFFKFKKQIFKNKLMYAKVPIAIFLIWCVSGIVLSVFVEFELFDENKRQEAVKTRTPLIVTVAKDTCTQCRLNGLIFLKTGVIREMQRQGRLKITQTTPDNPDIMPYLKRGDKNQILIFGKGKTKGQRLPNWTRPDTFKRFYQEAILSGQSPLSDHP